jgi:hypothetical protein
MRGNALRPSRRPSRVERRSVDFSITEKRLKNSLKHEDIKPTMPAGGARVTDDALGQQPVVLDVSQLLTVQCPLPG